MEHIDSARSTSISIRIRVQRYLVREIENVNDFLLTDLNSKPGLIDWNPCLSRARHSLVCWETKFKFHKLNLLK